MWKKEEEGRSKKLEECIRRRKRKAGRMWKNVGGGRGRMRVSTKERMD